MKFSFLKKGKEGKKQISDYKQELLLKQGREQFKSLIKKGLSVPVALLQNCKFSIKQDFYPVLWTKKKSIAFVTLDDNFSTISNALARQVTNSQAGNKINYLLEFLSEREFIVKENYRG